MQKRIKVLHIWLILPSTPWQSNPRMFSVIHTDQETRPFCSSLWFHLKSLYLDRRGKVLDGWWGCGTCGWVVIFLLLHGSHRSFSLCQSSIFSCRSSRWASVAQRSTFEQNGGWSNFFLSKSSDGQNGLRWVDNCTTYHPQWYLFSVFFWFNIFTLWGISFIFFPLHFRSQFLKAILFQRRNERRILKTKCLFSFIRWVLFTTSCYYVGNILSFKRRFIYFPSESTVHWKKENHSPPILHPIERNQKMGGPFKGVRNEEEPRGSG